MFITRIKYNWEPLKWDYIRNKTNDEIGLEPITFNSIVSKGIDDK